MKLAITGGTGFVGSRLVDAAIEAGHSVKALTRRPQAPRPSLIWVNGSLSDRGDPCRRGDQRPRCGRI